MIPGLGRGISPKKMQQMMKQMGIDIKEISDIEEVIIRTSNYDLVFKEPEVTVMDARGLKTFQIVGTPTEVSREIKIPEEDVKLVAEQTQVSESEARAALKETKGDLAAAILKLNSERAARGALK